jgi:hypothetical protein
MNNQIKENKLLVMIGVAVAVLATIVFAPTIASSDVFYHFPESSMEELASESDLIIQGVVINVQQGKDRIEEDEGEDDDWIIPTILSEIQVKKVIKGTWEDKTIKVSTEGDLSGEEYIPAAAKMKKSEKVILFLIKDPHYGTDAYTTYGMYQGKFDIDDNNQVKNKHEFASDLKTTTKGMNTTEFENNIYKILGKTPKLEPQLDKNLSPFDSNSNATTEVEDKTKVEEQKNEENMSEEKPNEEQQNEVKIPQEKSNEEAAEEEKTEVDEETVEEEEEAEPQPDLTEQFKNQDQCIEAANQNPDSGFTEDDCKDAFK